MFYSSYNGRVNSHSGDHLTLARAFALVGVLRNIDERLPLDMVLIYLSENDTAGLLRVISDKVDYSAKSLRSLATVADDVIPASVRKMAKNYLIRSFWWNVADVQSISNVSSSSMPDKDGRRSVYYTKTYPAAILKALDSMVITNGTNLTDITDVISIFHATVVNCGRSGTAISSNYADMSRTGDYRSRPPLTVRDHYAPMNENQRETFDRLCWTFDRYCEYCRNNMILPNQFVLGSVCNMLDIMLIMRGIADPKTALRCKNIYEYAKISRIASNQLSDDPRLKDVVNDGWTIEGAGRIYGDACLPADYLKFMKMTPQAIICTGLKARVEFYGKEEPVDLLPWGHGQWLINKVLENNTRPLLEVELYTLKEMEVRRRTILDLQRKWEADHPNGRQDYGDCPAPEVPCECDTPVGGV